jgi:hypothetical protein
VSETSRLAILTGSVREGRYGPGVAEQAIDHGGFEVDVIDLYGVDMPLTLPAEAPGRRRLPASPG